ncbi:hypothetical protein GT034_26345, partial [Streptomyces sp. SID2563]|nr:hypothetical protein [Streptomyces sp. SID2563]
GGDAALAWARDDHARASARCAELRSRLAAVSRTPDRFGTGAAAPVRPEAPEPEPAPAPRATPPARKRKATGARFAGLEAEDGGADRAPVLPAAPAASPRGARF